MGEKGWQKGMGGWERAGEREENHGCQRRGGRNRDVKKRREETDRRGRSLFSTRRFSAPGSGSKLVDQILSDLSHDPLMNRDLSGLMQTASTLPA